LNLGIGNHPIVLGDFGTCIQEGAFGKRGHFIKFEQGGIHRPKVVAFFNWGKIDWSGTIEGAKSFFIGFDGLFGLSAKVGKGTEENRTLVDPAPEGCPTMKGFRGMIGLMI
jgi:hypothetical protein